MYNFCFGSPFDWNASLDVYKFSIISIFEIQRLYFYDLMLYNAVIYARETIFFNMSPRLIKNPFFSIP